jgi:tRNA U34 5-methylaminomethyl-2-thiouridine-forming methyltransferase MnmC
MSLFSRLTKPKARAKLVHKSHKFLKSWKKKFHNYSGEEKSGFQIAFLLQGAITRNIILDSTLARILSIF